MCNRFLGLNKENVLLFIMVFVCYSYFFHRGTDANENSRLNLVYAVVNDGTLQIDKYHKNTIDKAYYDGHYYSDKAPGISLLAIPIYALFKFSAKLFSFNANDLVARYLIVIFIIALPSALLTVFIYQFLGYFNKNNYYRLMLTAGYSLGTVAFTYSTLFYGHQFTAAILFFCFYILFVMKQERKEDNKRIMLSGFLAGYAFITEHPAGIIAALIFIYLLVVLNRKGKIWFFLLGSLIPILALMTYNYLCFRNVFKIGIFYAANPTFSIPQSKGFVGITYPKPAALFSLCFSVTRGLFFLSPFLLLTVPGFYYFFKRKGYRNEYYLFLAISVCYLLFYSAFWSYSGGWTIGHRYLVPMLPFLTIPIIFSFDYLKSYPKKALISLGILSIVLVSVGTITEPHVPEEINNVLGGFSLPLLIRGYTAKNLSILLGLNGIYSLMPLFIFLIAGGIVLIRTIKKTEVTTGVRFTGETDKKTKLIENSLLIFLIFLILAVVILGKKSAYVYHIMGLEYAENNQYAKAFDEFDKAIKVAPGFSEAYYRLAILYENVGKDDKTIEVCQKLIEIKPNPVTHNLLGIIYHKKGMYDYAIEEYRKAINLNRNFAGAYGNLGISYDAKGLYSEGAKAHKKAIEIEPYNLEAYHNLAVGYIYQERFDDAIRIYKQAIDIDPGNAELHYGIGVVYKEKGIMKYAINEFEKYIQYGTDKSKIAEVKKWISKKRGTF